jgi:hypothetical protein
MDRPVRVSDPEWLSIFDSVPEAALRSGRWALDFAADRDAMFFSSHFASSSAGGVSTRGDFYAWCFG